MTSDSLSNMSVLSDLQKEIVDFRDLRDWKQFHNPKDLAISLVLESTEFLEHFQWKSNDEIASHLDKNKSDISDELADVFYWVLLIAHDMKIDLPEALKKKMEQNSKKYPVSKAKGKHIKYDKL